MIRYDLICEREHVFEAWFSTSSDYDVQAKAGLLCCAICGSHTVDKSIMAPNISTSRKQDAGRKAEAKKFAMMSEQAKIIADKVRADVERKCDYVGNKFTEEARAMHYGEKEERPIYGEASLSDARDLADEGIDLAPIPEPFMPMAAKAKKKLN